MYSLTGDGISQKLIELSEISSSASEIDGKVIPIDTIALLRAKTVTPSTVWVSGYYTRGDGAFGSNIFEWDSTSTETDNGGTIIKLTSIATGRYKLKHSGAVSVKWFGAKGDGIDDELSLFNAFEYTNSTLNKHIYIPSGTYRTNGMDWTDYSGMHIEGASKSSVILKAKDGWTGFTNLNNEKCFILTNVFYGDDYTENFASYLSTQFLTIENITIWDSSGATTDENTVGMYWGKTHRSKVDNLLIIGFGTCLELSHSWLVKFSNITCNYSYKYSLSLPKGEYNGISFDSCSLTNVRTSGTIHESAAALYTTASERVVFSGTYFEGNTPYGIVAAKAATVNLIGCFSEFKLDRVFFYAYSGYVSLVAQNCCFSQSIITAKDGVTYGLYGSGNTMDYGIISGSLRSCSADFVSWYYTTSDANTMLSYEVPWSSGANIVELYIGITTKITSMLSFSKTFNLSANNVGNYTSVHSFTIPKPFRDRYSTIRIKATNVGDNGLGSFDSEFRLSSKTAADKSVITKTTEYTTRGIENGLTMSFKSYDVLTGVLSVYIHSSTGVFNTPKALLEFNSSTYMLPS